MAEDDITKGYFKNFLDYYKEGYHKDVWEQLIFMGDTIRDSKYFPDVFEVTMELMDRVRKNILLLKERLINIGYSFKDPEKAYVPPDNDIESILDIYEEENGLLPLSLKCFYIKVGSVDFRQSKEQLIFYGDEKYRYAPILNVLGDLNPLLVFPVKTLLKCKVVASGKTVYSFSDDEFGKAGYSGNLYTLSIPNPSADGRIEFLGDISFVEYLRVSIESGGFYGRTVMYDDYDDIPLRYLPKDDLFKELSEDLIPF